MLSPGRRGGAGPTYWRWSGPTTRRVRENQFTMATLDNCISLGWANLSQCGGTEEEIITKAKILIAKVPFEKIKVKEEINVEETAATVSDHSGPSIDVKLEPEPEIPIKEEKDIKQENLDEDEEEEETCQIMNYNYKFSCIKCSKMFRTCMTCLKHMTNVCRVTLDDLSQDIWEKIWRRLLKSAAKQQALQLKRRNNSNPSEGEIVAQIQMFFAANPNKKKKVVLHLRNIYGRKKFIKFGFGRLTEFLERHGL